MHKFSESFSIYNMSTILFFIALLAMNALANTAPLIAFWYFTAGVSFLLGLYRFIRRFSIRVLLLCIVCAVTGVICYKANHNMSITRYLYLVICPMIGLLFIDPRVKVDALKYVIVIYALYIAASFLIGGIKTAIFQSSSTNFVSVFLLYPTVIYYTKLENENRKIPVYPMIIVWILCIFARGRGGILTTTFLLIWLVMRAYKEQLKNKRNKVIIGCGLVLITTVAVLAMIATSEIWLHWGAFEYFNDRGLESSSRIVIWTEYFDAIARHPSYLLYGAPFTDLTLQVTEIHGNMHNSFFNIHIYNGLFMFMLVAIFLIKATSFAISQHRYIYLACLITFCMRGFTDNVFWGPYGTPVFFTLLLFPYDPDQNKLYFWNRMKWSILHGRTRIE